MNEITPALIYWITRFDTIFNVCLAITVIVGAATAVMLFFAMVARCSEDEAIATQLFRGVRITLPVVVIAILFLIFVPTKKDMAAILVLPKIANSETVEQLGDGVKTLAVEWIEELRPKKEESK